MKYFPQSVLIPPVFAYMIHRWHGPFRSNFGFTLLAILVIVILAVLVFDVVRGRERGSAGTGNAGQSK